MARTIKLVIVNGKTKSQNVFELSPAPETVKYMKPSLAVTQRLLYNGVYSNNRGLGISKVTISGTFGQKRRVFKGQEKTGLEVHEEFMLFLDEYDRLKSSRDEKERASFMEFHDFERDVHYVVSKKDIDDPQTRENRLHYKYTLDLDFIKKIERKYTIERPTPLVVMSSSSKMIQKGTEAVQKEIGKLANLRNEVASEISLNLIRPVLQLKSAIDAAIEEGTNAVSFPVDSFNRILGTITNSLEDLGERVNDTFFDLASSLRNTQRVLFRLKTYPEIFLENLEDSTEDLSRQFVHAIGGDFEETGFYQRTPSDYIQTSSTGARSYTIQKGDTLADVALKELGDTSRWKEIALLNNMNESPYITSDGARGTKKFGETLLIPDTSGVSSEGMSGNVQNGKENDERFYGKDFVLELDGNSLFDRCFSKDGTKKTIQGIRNLYQAVSIKQMTLQGTLKEDPTFGRRISIAEGAEEGDLLFESWNQKESMESDPRIEKVEIRIEQVGNKVSYHTNIFPSNGTGQDDSLTS